MLRAASLLALLALTSPGRADDKKVTVRFLGGEKKTPIEGLKVSIRTHTGDWSEDKRRKRLTEGTTDKKGGAGFTLAPGRYYVDIESEKELPYLYLPVGYKGYPKHYDRVIKVGDDVAFDFNLADACKLTLRAVDADTGKGIPGVRFVTENDLGEQWGIAILGDNLGAKQDEKAEKEVADKDGYFVRYVGPREGYTYFGWQPKGYEIVGDFEVAVKSPIGTTKAEHAFKYKKK
ncbi:hypothetical protein J8F10_32210 [Gemmata sp. G18]|uniref:Carboxypeptidase regulatory-like domain-containing protein n=1 Tax=Gemmata palustris TaxID=2822762 RepID=A0ABS5C1T0_9BACT|nr:hypothetical protein [Gemmata palustris]MBP3959932.1 hypothetical protein [Gemmata palustris]